MCDATSLRDLVDAEWVTTSITAKPEHELGPLFEQHGLAPPRLVMQAHSALTLITALLYSDLLTMLPVQWADFEIVKNAVQAIPVIEQPLAAPPIAIIQRASLPLTPAAEHFCDLMRRASGQLASSDMRSKGAEGLRGTGRHR